MQERATPSFDRPPSRRSIDGDGHSGMSISYSAMMSTGSAFTRDSNSHSAAIEEDVELRCVYRAVFCLLSIRVRFIKDSCCKQDTRGTRGYCILQSIEN
jgi:hypothetical protein